MFPPVFWSVMSRKVQTHPSLGRVVQNRRAEAFKNAPVFHQQFLAYLRVGLLIDGVDTSEKLCRIHRLLSRPAECGFIQLRFDNFRRKIPDVRGNAD